jgi:pimeloyl-ACP methyl ester carboxylesterase
VHWTAYAQASLVARVLERLGIERATVVGHSWGTLVALALAIEHKERVSGVVLVDGFYHPEFRPDAWLLSMPAWPVVGAVVSRTTSPVTGRLLWPALLRTVFGPAEAPPRFRALSPWAFLRPASLRAAGEESAMLNAEARKLSARYAEIEAPVMILAGTRDRIVDEDEHVDPLRQALEHAEAETFPGVGHMLHHADADAVARAIARVEAKAPRGHGARALVPVAAALLPQAPVEVRSTS